MRYFPQVYLCNFKNLPYLVNSLFVCLSISISPSAAEVFPTGVRTTFQGISAAAGKVGAVMANLLFSYVDVRTSFYLSAAFSLLGIIITWLFLPDTTGMNLDELDRMHKYALADAFEHYHGEAVNKGHLSPFER